ncbi:Hypothetical predicted protein [Podarcis lilfordi]|uniref:Uncharacterized protein n=1 Tax=Podarcis lilfordi TaxID=74358 RepID=A0AA35PJ49_9SAUR|nr:Hypothetical predicted protein [Podarcis lilfordi]
MPTIANRLCGRRDVPCDGSFVNLTLVSWCQALTLPIFCPPVESYGIDGVYTRPCPPLQIGDRCRSVTSWVRGVQSLFPFASQSYKPLPTCLFVHSASPSPFPSSRLPAWISLSCVFTRIPEG